MSTQRIIVLSLTFFLVVLLDILWAPYLPVVRLVLNATLLMVIALTIGERVVIGLSAAVIAGITLTLFSAVSGPGYILAFMSAVGACWVFSHKIVTTRSAVSFVSTIMVGTAVYALALIITDSLLTLFNRQRLHLDLILIVQSAALQIIVHPIVLSVLWRLFGRHQYHRLPTSSAQSF